ncbi:acyl-CoA dehydrogenase family protein [Nocardioides sp. NPDC051685]|uniref:acyl-CoA dehydrogenase family protein n=1 Tax=Nocardioides sp. NPDC051685 TaxID=3364334 RepID=UPI00379D0F14
MTLIDTPEVSTEVDFLERARSIAGIIEAEAEAGEKATDVTDVAGQALADQGLFWMFAPREYGGGQVDIVTGLKVIEEISRADGSTGWVLMATSIGTRNASFFMPQKGRDELFGGPQKAICAGYAAPLGTATETEGGLIGGAERLHFASGSKFCSHLAVTVRVLNPDGTQKMLNENAPDIRAFFAPMEKIEMLGNWDVMGLVGTGSYDYALPEQFLDENYTLRSTFWTDPSQPVVGSELDRAAIGFAGHIGVVLGLMKRSLEEVSRIVTGKTRQGYPDGVDHHPVFLKELAEADAKYHSIRAYAHAILREAEEAAHTHGEVPAELTARIRQVTTWVHTIGTDVINFASLWGATQTFRNPSVLGRLTRDMTVARNHLAADHIGLVQSAIPILNSWRQPTT